MPDTINPLTINPLTINPLLADLNEKLFDMDAERAAIIKHSNNADVRVTDLMETVTTLTETNATQAAEIARLKSLGQAPPIPGTLPPPDPSPLPAPTPTGHDTPATPAPTSETPPATPAPSVQTGTPPGQATAENVSTFYAALVPAAVAAAQIEIIGDISPQPNDFQWLSGEARLHGGIQPGYGLCLGSTKQEFTETELDSRVVGRPYSPGSELQSRIMRVTQIECGSPFDNPPYPRKPRVVVPGNGNFYAALYGYLGQGYGGQAYQMRANTSDPISIDAPLLSFDLKTNPVLHVTGTLQHSQSAGRWPSFLLMPAADPFSQPGLDQGANLTGSGGGTDNSPFSGGGNYFNTSIRASVMFRGYLNGQLALNEITQGMIRDGSDGADWMYDGTIMAGKRRADLGYDEEFLDPRRRKAVPIDDLPWWEAGHPPENVLGVGGETWFHPEFASDGPDGKKQAYAALGGGEYSRFDQWIEPATGFVVIAETRKSFGTRILCAQKFDPAIFAWMLRAPVRFVLWFVNYHPALRLPNEEWGYAFAAFGARLEASMPMIDASFQLAPPVTYADYKAAV